MGYGESVGTGKNFENYVTKGDPQKIMSFMKSKDQMSSNQQSWISL
jgi:hypothetical protein